MQKKIIALAVAAAFSTPAFADVGFYGIVDGAVASISASGLKGDLVAVSSGASESRLGVKATEDIGNGMTAVAVLEYGLDSQTVEAATDTVNNFKARQKMLAVAGDFGTVATGYLQTAAYDFLAKYDPIYGSSSSAHTIVSKGLLVGSGAARAQRAVAYISPNINGLVLAANYSTAIGATNLAVPSGNAAGLKTTAYLLSANYAVDALSVGAVYAATSNSSSPAVATNKEWALGASYDLGVAKVMGTYQSDTASTGGSASTVLSGAVVMPVASGAVAVMYAKNSMGGVSANSGAAFTGGYLHTFTKSTTGYIVLSQVTNGSASTTYTVSNNLLGGAITAGGSSTLLGVGLRKKF